MVVGCFSRWWTISLLDIVLIGRAVYSSLQPRVVRKLEFYVSWPFFLQVNCTCYANSGMLLKISLLISQMYCVINQEILLK